MTPAPRPRRSALYMPASNPRALAKARGLAADVIILDLEDAVAPEAKAQARLAANATAREGGFGPRELVIRVNGLETPWGHADLDEVADAGADAILVPKVRSGADVRRWQAALAGAPPATTLWAMIETPQALLALEAIAATAKETRLAGFVLGLNDLARETGARETADRAPFFVAMSLTVAAARAHGLVALDGVHNAIDDPEGLERACAQGAAFGFDGKTLIHPSHLAICNRAFSPEAGALAWARQVIEAFAAAENVGRGAVKVGGRLAERLHLEEARKLVALSEAIASRDPVLPAKSGPV